MTRRICHITTAHQPNDIRIFHKECLSLAAAGYEVHLVAQGSLSEEDSSKILFHSIGKTPNSRFQRFTDATTKALDIARSIDAAVYHIHDPELLRSAIRLKKFGALVVYDAHEDLPRQVLSKPYIPKFIKPFISAVTEYFENRWVSKLDAVVAATEIIGDRFRKIKTQTAVVKNYPIADNFIYIEHQKRDNSVVYAGAITEARGIFTMMEAIQKCPETRLKLAGRFETAQLEYQVKLHKAWTQVDYLGELSPTDVAILYENCMAGLVVLKPYQNYREALPIKMFEYMAAALPVICSDFDIWKGIVEENYCGIAVDPLNSESIAIAIRSLINDPKLCSVMGENGRNEVIAKYSWNSEFEKLRLLYTSLNP